MTKSLDPKTARFLRHVAAVTVFAVAVALSSLSLAGAPPEKRPTPDTTDTLAATPDSLLLESDTLTVALDTVVVPVDTMAVVQDTVVIAADTLIAEPDTFAVQPGSIPVAYRAKPGGGVEAFDAPDGSVYDVPFGVGERLRYYMEFSFVKAGMSEMSLVGVEDVEGRPAYHFSSRVKSTKGIDFIYKVRDYVESWFDVGGLYSQRYERNINEGSYHSRKYFDYNHDTGWVAISNENGPKGITPALPYTHNIISALFWVRAQDLEENTELVIPVHDLDVQYPLTVKVYEKETIKVPAGEFHCIKVEPVITSEGLFKKAGRVFVWITDDERRIPVRMSTKIPVGTIDGNLVEYRLGEPYYPGIEPPPRTKDDEEWNW